MLFVPKPAEGAGADDRVVRVGVFAALRDGDRLLLIHRRDLDMWCLPGGLFEHGESVTSCLRRECREELGADAELGPLLGVYSKPETHVFHFASGLSVHYVTLVFSGHPPTGALQPCVEEVRDVGLFARDELPRVVPSHRVWIEDAFRDPVGLFIR